MVGFGRRLHLFQKTVKRCVADVGGAGGIAADASGATNAGLTGGGLTSRPCLRRRFRQQQRRLIAGAAAGCCCCCCCGGGGGPDPQFARWSLWLDEALNFKQMVVWDKGGLGMGWHYRRNYETILVGEKPGSACHWYGGHTQANVVRIPRIKPTADGHPTPKPPELMGLFVRLHSQPGELILDPFAGAGTTLRAAKDMGRRAIGIEIEERYCEIAAKRMGQEVLFPADG